MDIPQNLARAQGLLTARRFGDAERLYRKILKRAPKHPVASFYLGVALLQTGKGKEAAQQFSIAVKAAPNNPLGHDHLGQALLMAGQIEKALASLGKAATLAPNSPETAFNHARALEAAGQLEEAEAAYRKAIALAPNLFPALTNLGGLLVKTKRFREAEGPLLAARRLNPRAVEPLGNLVVCLERMSRLAEAEKLSEEMIRLAPDYRYSKIMRARLNRRTGDLAAARALLDDVIRAGEDQVAIQMALSDQVPVLDAMGHYREAFETRAAAKKIQLTLPDGKDWSAAAYYRTVVDYRKWIAGDRAPTATAPQYDARDPVFFVGFPRSGTTLMEQILDSHSKLVTTAENSPLQVIIADAESILGREFDLPGDIDTLAGDEIGRLQTRFFQVAREVTQDRLSDRILVDKMPLNIIELALVERIFPRARVLVAIRDPRDVCLSCYMQQFRLNPAMANFLELSTTGALYEAVMDLWLRYRESMGLSWLEYRYEDLIDDFDASVRGVLDFIGVEWEESVTGYAEHARKRDISTPSYAAVTEAINRKAVARWRNYREQLAPVLPVLAPFVREFGYDPD